MVKKFYDTNVLLRKDIEEITELRSDGRISEYYSHIDRTFASWKQEYRDQIKTNYIILGKEAEEKNKDYIAYLWERKHITYSQRDHLEKVNKNLGRAF